MEKITVERCCTCREQVVEALENGSDRIELCEQLEIGGITPSEENIRMCIAAGLPVNVLIRPRSGNFVWTEDEVSQMLRSIAFCKSSGCNGVVIGALDSDGNVDIPTMERLVDAARPLEITFHRAFDECSDPHKAFEDVISLGCERLLTSGHAPSAPQGAQLISELVRMAEGRIIVMAGAGVRQENLEALRQATHAKEFHSSHILHKQ